MSKKMVYTKIVDKQGRLVLPSEWRKKYLKKRRVKLEINEDMIVVKPCELPDITEFFDMIEVDISSDLSDWKAVRREPS